MDERNDGPLVVSVLVGNMSGLAHNQRVEQKDCERNK
jgi:hypothetical protein